MGQSYTVLRGFTMNKIETWLKKKAKAYIKKGGMVCPICGSSNISGGSFDMEEAGIYQYCVCFDCDSEWTDMYRLQTVTIEHYDEKHKPKNIKTDPNRSFNGG